MKNTTGLYKHQRDNQGKRRKLPVATPKAKLVPVVEYEYERVRRTHEAFELMAEEQRDEYLDHLPCGPGESRG